MRIPTFLPVFLLLMQRSFSLVGPPCRGCKRKSCDCSRQNLTAVPAAPSNAVTELDLSFNSLQTIAGDDFLSFAGLRSLILNNNRIETIEEQAFAPLTRLEKLDLSSNRLETLSAGWFSNHSLLQHLNLLGNKYVTLGPDNPFKTLTRLKTLRFGGPKLTSVTKGAFSGLGGLEEVVFDGRRLKHYAPGSLKQIGPLKYVTLGLKDPFLSNQALVRAVLSDVVHPNTTLIFANTRFFLAYQMSPFRKAYDGGATRIIFKDVTMTLTASMAFLNVMSGSNITMVAFEDTTLILTPLGEFTSPRLDRLEAVVLKNIQVPQFYSFPALLFLEPLLSTLRKVSVLNCRMFVIPCDSANDFSNLDFLDVSGNLLNDPFLSEMMCNGKGGLWSLQTLNISRNNLHTINSRLFTKLDKLENLDMSGNVFKSMPETCHWPPNLRFLNLSSTFLAEATACLPASLRVLDLSNNDLTVFNVELPFLTELHIHGNKIGTFPRGVLYPHLTFLSIQNNDLLTFGSKELDSFNNLSSLEANSDKYICSCDFVAFMTSGLANQRVTIADELEMYVCDSPDAVRGESAADVALSVFECHTALAFSLVCAGILMVILLGVGLCYKFSVMWYLKMTWAWLRAKRKPKLKKGKLEYDAFVSYSEMDSGWVEAHLVPELEQAEPPLRLCLHKRDFLPGSWILDNIMDAIEKSHRTLFILSRHFVTSEWCKYELDYTHFRLFDHNDDTVVLILLEPIDKDTVPKKFCKLRRMMNSRTYLEWPDEDGRIPRFWDSLRTAIKRPETDDGERESVDSDAF